MSEAEVAFPKLRPRQPRLRRILRWWQANGTAYLARRAWLRFGFVARNYSDWVRRYDALQVKDVSRIRARIAGFSSKPTIDIVVHVQNASASEVVATIESVRSQLYEKWTLVVALPAEILDRVSQAIATDPRIAVQISEGNAIASLKRALAQSAGAYFLMLDPGCRLAPHAFYMVAEEIHSAGNPGVIYSDEDAADADGRRHDPKFKPGWSPDLLLAQDYLGPLTVIRRNLLRLDELDESAADCVAYECALQAIERIAAEAVRHVPFVLVHNGSAAISSGRTGDIVRQSAQAVQRHLVRTGIAARVDLQKDGLGWRVRRTLPHPHPRVSIIIPTRDRLDFLQVTMDSVLSATHYSNYEVVVVDNQSVEPRTLDYLSRLSILKNVRVLRYDHPFNYAAINNFAARQCDSPVLALLNNDVKVINNDWLSELISHALRPEVGAVGALLLYPGDVIQHAGIIVGCCGAAVNCCTGIAMESGGYSSRAAVVQNYSAVTGACLVTRASVFAEVGGLNEADLPIAFNDVDYCLKLREKGYLVVWTPHARLHHFESVSRGDDMAAMHFKRFHREMNYLVRRWRDFMTAGDPYYSPNLSLEQPFALATPPRVVRPWLVSG